MRYQLDDLDRRHCEFKAYMQDRVVIILEPLVDAPYEWLVMIISAYSVMGDDSCMLLV